MIIVHDGALDPRTEERQPRQHGAPQVDLAARRGSREPSSRGADLTSLAIELVIGAITRELSSLIIKLIFHLDCVTREYHRRTAKLLADFG